MQDISYTRLFKGYTLIELISVITITSITASIGVPGFARMVSNSQRTASINQFATVLALARSQAIQHYKNVTLCPSTNSIQCTGGFEWQKGYISFIDNNQNRQHDAQEKIISITPQVPHALVIKSSTGRRKITFKPSGRSPGSNTSIRFCSHSNHVQRALIISRSGRARLSSKLPNGNKITCS